MGVSFAQLLDVPNLQVHLSTDSAVILFQQEAGIYLQISQFILFQKEACVLYILSELAAASFTTRDGGAEGRMCLFDLLSDVELPAVCVTGGDSYYLPDGVAPVHHGTVPLWAQPGDLQAAAWTAICGRRQMLRPLLSASQAGVLHWWIRSRKLVPKTLQRGFDILVFLIGWLF